MRFLLSCLGANLIFATLVGLHVGFRALAQNADLEPPPVEDSKKPDPVPQVPKADTFPEGLALFRSTGRDAKFALVMDKSQRTLTIWRATAEEPTFVMALPADFGRSLGDKTSAGDHKTPEGIYFFQEIKEGRELNFDEYGDRAYTMDYPNFFDLKRGKSGGGIWLHAVPDTKSLWRGSRGCIVVRNSVIRDLGAYIQPRRTPILVQEKVTFLDKESWRKLGQEWSQWLESWRQSWEQKDLARYMEFYGDDFKSLGMRRNQWQRYKAELNERYEFIKVSVEQPLVLKHNGDAIVQFNQNYQSDKNQDFGIKTLKLTKNGDTYKILSEEWQGIGAEKVLAQSQ